MLPASAGAATLTADITDDLSNIADSNCSLREAIAVANVNSEAMREPTCTDDAVFGDDTIILPNLAAFQVSLASSMTTPDDNLEGDLDIQTAPGNSLTIDGASEEVIEQDMTPDDRVIDLLGTGSLTIIDSVVRNGNATGDGGGIQVAAGASLVLNTAAVRDSDATGFGGGIGTSGGTITLHDALVKDNFSTRAFAAGGGIGAGANANVTIDTGTSIETNHATAGHGGGIHSNGTLSISDSVIIGNDANASSGNGGGIHKESGTATITDSEILANETDGASGQGGGIHNSSSSLMTLTDVNLQNNTSGQGAAGIWRQAGPLTMTRGGIRSNFATFTGAAGEAFGAGLTLVADADATLNEVEIFDNVAQATTAGGGARGGAINLTGSGTTLTFSNGALLDNHVTAVGGSEEGGGIYLNNSGAPPSAVLINSTVSGNDADTAGGDGGAIFNSNSALRISHTTISGNDAADAGEALRLTGTDNTTVFNSIVAEDEPAVCSDQTGDSIVSGGHNIDSGTSCGFIPEEGATPTSLEMTDPQLVTPLALNGGVTLNFALAPTSPAVNLVPVSSCHDGAMTPGFLTRDQRGFPRPSPSVGACDAGSFELTLPEPTSPLPAGSPPPAGPTGQRAAALRKCKKKKKKARKKCRKRALKLPV